jgi:hypothetical protein
MPAQRSKPFDARPPLPVPARFYQIAAAPNVSGAYEPAATPRRPQPRAFPAVDARPIIAVFRFDSSSPTGNGNA